MSFSQGVLPSINKSDARQVMRTFNKCCKKKIREVEDQLVEDAVSSGVFLGEGTFGTCYMTHDEDGCPLSVKVLKKKQKTLAKLLAELYGEARQMAVVEAIPGMIRLVGVSLWPVQAIVTRYGGDTLEKMLDEKRLSSSQAVKVMLQVVDSVSRLSEARLSHGDLKIDNVVVDVAGEEPVATLIDLGWMYEFGYNPNWLGKKAKRIYAPELYEGCPFSPETQIYQVGRVMRKVLEKVSVEDANIERLVGDALGVADARPSLEKIYQGLACVLAKNYIDSVRKSSHQSGKRKRAAEDSGEHSPKKLKQ